MNQINKINLAQKIEDLYQSLSVSNSPWNSWEKEFIQDVIERPIESMSSKQKIKLEELWEKL